MFTVPPRVNNKILIQYVQSYDVLYDATHAKYSDTRLKDELWEQIAFAMGVPVSLCKRSWFSLRDSYRRSLRKRRDAIRDNLPYHKWRYENEMQFLEPHILIRDPKDRIEIHFPALQDEMVTGPLEFEPKAKQSRDGSSLMKTTRSTENYEPRSLNTDHIDAFLMGIGATLKNFTPRNQNLAKTKIFSLVADMELQQITEYKEHWTDLSARMQLERDDDEQASEPGGSESYFESDSTGDTKTGIPKIQVEEGEGSGSRSEERTDQDDKEGICMQHIKKEKSFDGTSDCDY